MTASMGNITRPTPLDDHTLLPFITTFAFISVLYGLWLVVFWPGLLGQDGLAIIWEIERTDGFQSGKPIFWYYFVKFPYLATGRVESPIAIQLALSALFFARILAWTWKVGLKKSYWILLFFITLAPHTLITIGALNADGIYAAATAALIFESWLIFKTRCVNLISFFILFFSLPLAVFARPNGIIMLPIAGVLLFYLSNPDKIKIVFIVAFWCVLNPIANHAHKTNKHGATFPLALYETVNFLQPRPMNLWRAQPRVSEKTIKTLEKYTPISEIIKSYDKDYWDPLSYDPKGPFLLRMEESDKAIIADEFFSYNLWQNIPAFFGSRVNIFLTSVLAEGAAPSLAYSKYIIPQINTKSKYRKFRLEESANYLEKIHALSYQYRLILWTSFYGIIILLISIAKGIQWRDIPLLTITLPLLAQLIGIFFFSIAGEYRYLFHFFTLPLALIPILLFSRKQKTSQAT